MQPLESNVKSRSLKVVQTVLGRFHHFDLARQLHQRGSLKAIFTGYPRWKLRDEQLPQNCIRTFPWLMTPLMTKWRIGWQSPSLDRDLSWLVAETLDKHVACNLPDCDVFVGISGSGLRTGRSNRARGGKYVCDRGSSHIRFADKLIREEFRLFGQEFRGIDQRVIAKEEAEYAEADLITVPSGFCERSFLAQGVEKTKIRVIPYGVDLSRFAPGGVRSNEAFEILYVGQVSFRKGIPYLLRAFHRLQHPHKRLRIVGAIQPELRDEIARHAHAQIEYLGPQTSSSVRGLMAASHVFVLPSIEDGFGLVLSEALASGCPIIATENTGAPDLITDGVEGFIVPIRDLSALADRLERLCQDRELLARMSAAALARVCTLGGWNDYGERYHAAMQELCGIDAVL